MSPKPERAFVLGDFNPVFNPNRIYVVRGRALRFMLRLWERLDDTSHQLSDEERKDLANTLSGFLISDVSDLDELIAKVYDNPPPSSH